MHGSSRLSSRLEQGLSLCAFIASSHYNLLFTVGYITRVIITWRVKGSRDKRTVDSTYSSLIKYIYYAHMI